MRDLNDVDHNPIMEEIVDILCTKVDNDDRKFFRAVTIFFLAKMAATMRVKMKTEDRGIIPVNVYAMAMAVSGVGKGYSVDVLENKFLASFQKRFTEDTFPIISEDHLWKEASLRAARNSTDEQEEYDKLKKEFDSYGATMFSFDSGTSPAVKQYRQKLLMSGIGAINFQMDEMGNNLESNTELMDLFLELYDVGKVKQKATKNSNENKRGEERIGSTPTNMFLFGTPSKVLDGGTTEESFYKYLDIGYARRCIFAYGFRKRRSKHMTAREIFSQLSDPAMEFAINKWDNYFADLADPAKFNWELHVPEEVSIELIEYKIQCEAEADTYPEFEEIRKTEMSHRYFKAMKIAGTLAYIEGFQTVTMDHLYQAIKLVEESGEAFQLVLNRERPYVRLAKYLAATKVEQTHADLHEALPFYKASVGARNEMMNMAMAWGYRQHIIIRKTFLDGIEFFQGETLKETNLDEMNISYSADVASNYNFTEAPFDLIPNLLKTGGMNWCNHGFVNGHRAEQNVAHGFNLLVLDVDGGTPIWTAQSLLSEYKYIIQTTKRHNPEEEHRYRIIIPINYILELDREDYDEFMKNILEWFPFPVDDQANQRSRKWACNADAEIYTNDGMMLDALRFVPKTHKNEQYKTQFETVKDMDNLERWFANNIGPGNRNHQMLKYTMALVDSGYTYKEVENRVLNFNNQLGKNGLSAEELQGTVLVTAAKKINGI